MARLAPGFPACLSRNRNVYLTRMALRWIFEVFGDALRGRGDTLQFLKKIPTQGRPPESGSRILSKRISASRTAHTSSRRSRRKRGQQNDERGACGALPASPFAHQGACCISPNARRDDGRRFVHNPFVFAFESPGPPLPCILGTRGHFSFSPTVEANCDRLFGR